MTATRTYKPGDRVRVAKLIDEDGMFVTVGTLGTVCDPDVIGEELTVEVLLDDYREVLCAPEELEPWAPVFLPVSAPPAPGVPVALYEGLDTSEEEPVPVLSFPWALVVGLPIALVAITLAACTAAAG